MSKENYKPGLHRDVDKELVKKLSDEEKVELTIEGYNKIASVWDKTRQNMWPELQAAITQYIKPNTSILDLGCGNGRLYPLIQSLNEEKNFNLHYLGVDPASELIQIAKSKYENESHPKLFEITDGFSLNNKTKPSNLNLKDQEFDQVISIAVLHHIPESLIRDWLSEAYRVTKLGTISIFTTWNMFETNYDLDENDEAVIGFIHEKGTRFVKGYTNEKLKEIFTGVGYTKIELQEVKRESGMTNTLILAYK
jgi:ubiquinone/menaquinone biosynthesis C-methylase UbiE